MTPITSKTKFAPIPKEGHECTMHIGQILLVWLVITAQVFGKIVINEVDTLPAAKQFVQPDWLPNDWYLNLDIAYRRTFNLIMGPIISRFGHQFSAIFGRLLGYLLLAVAMYVFFRALRLRISLGILILLSYLTHQSLIAGEWIAGGVDTKTFAYCFALLSFSAFLSRHYLAGFLSAGAAMSFHVLIGLYAMFCLAVAIALNHKAFWPDRRTFLTKSWTVLVTGIFGIQAIVQQMLQNTNDINNIQAWKIYVEYRVPHHVNPGAWVGERWKYELLFDTCLFLLIYLLGQGGAKRFLSAYALGGIILFAVGLTTYALGYTHLLRFYWFRYPDTMIRLTSVVLIALLLNDVMNGQTPLRLPVKTHIPGLQTWLRRGLQVLAPSLAALTILISGFQLITTSRSPVWVTRHGGENTQTMFEWIKRNTPKDAVFLIDPMLDTFYIYAQRAMFVSFRHSPSSAVDILEWYDRIILCNGGTAPKTSGLLSWKEIQPNFYHLDEGSIQQIAKAYGISYYIGKTGQPLPFERVYRTGDLTLFKVAAYEH